MAPFVFSVLTTQIRADSVPYILILIYLIVTGTSVKYVLEQDKAAFIRLAGTSVLQSAANSIVSPSLR